MIELINEHIKKIINGFFNKTLQKTLQICALNNFMLNFQYN